MRSDHGEARSRARVSQTTPVRVRIPQNLKLEQLHELNPVEFRFEPEVAALLIDTILMRIDPKAPNRYVNLKAVYLQQLHWKYHLYLDWLVKVGVVECDRDWRMGIKSLGYRLSENYRGVRTRRISIKKPKHVRAFRRRNDKAKSVVVHREKQKKADPTIPFNYFGEQYRRCMVTDDGYPFSSCLLLHPDCVPYKLLYRYLYSGYKYDQGVAEDGDVFESTLRDRVRDYSPVMAYLKGHLKRVRFDPLVYEFPKQQVRNKSWSRGKARGAVKRLNAFVNSLENDTLIFIRDRTAGRLHTNLSSLDHEFRDFLRWDGSTALVSLDVRSCQPYLLLRLLREVDAPQEVGDQWAKAVCDADIYQVLACNWGVTRDKAKEIWCMIAFAHSASTFKADDIGFLEKKAQFACAYPMVAEVMRLAKGRNHRELSHRLQQYEAHVMLERIVPRLMALEIPVLTIHDSVIVPEGNARQVRMIMQVELKAFAGYAPVIMETKLGVG